MRHYFDSSTRAEFALHRFGDRLTGTVLDVGAGGSATIFRQQLGRRYIAIDVSNARATPDLICDFEREPLPFADNQFDTVLCFDVLEHVDSPHRLFAECARVARRNVIVSLPNNWPGLFWSLIVGRNVLHRSGYGLPQEEPPKGHRHKWFFNWEEGESFVRANASRHGLSVAGILPVYERGTTGLFRLSLGASKGGYPEILAVSKSVVQSRRPRLIVPFMITKHLLAIPISWVEEVLRRIVWGFGSRRYENLFCRQLWAVLEKAPN